MTLRSMKLTAFIDESIEKHKSICSTGALKSYVKLQGKNYLNKNIYFLVIFRFSCR